MTHAHFSAAAGDPDHMAPRILPIWAATEPIATRPHQTRRPCRPPSSAPRRACRSTPSCRSSRARPASPHRHTGGARPGPASSVPHDRVLLPTEQPVTSPRPARRRVRDSITFPIAARAHHLADLHRGEIALFLADPHAVAWDRSRSTTMRTMYSPSGRLGDRLFDELEGVVVDHARPDAVRVGADGSSAEPHARLSTPSRRRACTASASIATTERERDQPRRPRAARPSRRSSSGCAPRKHDAADRVDAVGGRVESA